MTAANATQTGLQVFGWFGVFLGASLFVWGIRFDGRQWWRRFEPFADNTGAEQAALDRRLHEDGPLPGSTTCLVLRVNDLRGGSRRVIWEASTKQGATISLSLTGDHAFLLAVLDTRGRAYSVDIPLGSDGLPLGKAIYLLIEVGTATNYSFARLSLNGEFFRGKAVGHSLDLGDHEWQTSIGGDGGGRNNATVDFYGVVAINGILNAVDRANLASFFQRRIPDMERGVAISFDGLAQSMRSASGGGNDEGK